MGGLPAVGAGSAWGADQMSVSTTCRQATYDELVAENDRRGKVIEALEAEIERMNKWLSGKPFEPSWENPDGPTAA